MFVCVVIPAFNEQTTIKDVVQNLTKSLMKLDRKQFLDLQFKIVVVDDGSVDQTGFKAQGAGAMVLRHCVNRGQGAALVTGINYSLARGADIIVHMDGDGQHDSEDLKILLLPLFNKECDVVLGSRFLGQAININITKFLVLKGGVLFTRIFSGISVTDSHCGLRALTRQASLKIKIDQDGMAHASEILDKIQSNNLVFKEVPVTVRYTKYSKSKGQSIFNAYRIVWNLVWEKIYNKYCNRH